MLTMPRSVCCVSLFLKYKLFSKLEIITIIHQPEWPKKLFTAQCSSLPGIDWREGTSQIVKCVGVETPHCGDVVDPHCQDVEMWWIHIFSVAVHINFEFIQELT